MERMQEKFMCGRKTETFKEIEQYDFDKFSKIEGSLRDENKDALHSPISRRKRILLRLQLQGTMQDSD